jgi:hypothetical protein
MLAALADHLWQSCLCLVVIAMLILLMRRQPALLRLWMWRIAALKFLAPFGLLYGLGHWWGFPSPRVTDEAPAWLVTFFDRLEPLLGPAHAASLGAMQSLALSVLLAGLPAAWGLAIARQMRIERIRAHWEQVDVDFGRPALPGMGFFKAAFLTTLGIFVVGGAIAAGGVDDRQHRHALLIDNVISLRSASVVVELAKPGMGERSRVYADTCGVLIRNANVQELLALAYGVSHAAVMGDQMASSWDAEPSNFWLISPRYDVQVIGRVREPEKFEPYALHQVITRMLAERFSIEVHVDGKCAPPCGRYGVPLSDSPL